ncbi:MAG: cation diffusion facilitator family transporter [Acidimicrobiales bacterium]
MAGTHGTKAIIAAFLANFGIAIMKFVAYVFTGSGAMLAEGIHSVADAGNQLLLLLGGRRARRAPTPSHPFGYGRERYFWAFVVALVLFSLGSAFSIYEGINKIRHPHEVESPIWAFAVLGIAIVLELFSFRTAIQESRPLKGDASWWSFIRHSRIPELPVVLLEDLGALLGLVFALIAVSLTVATDDTIWDAVGTLMIGGLLGIIAIILAWEMKSLLIGESATVAKQKHIEEAISGRPSVRRLLHMRTEHIGPEELLIGAKIEFDAALSMGQLAAAVNDVEDAVRAAVPEARIMYLEPDIAASAEAAPATAPTASAH